MNTAALTRQSESLKGGEWIVKETPADAVFVPEDFGEEAHMMAETCQQFLEKEVYPHLAAIDSHEKPELMPHLLDMAGELGLLSTSIPQEYGGLDTDFITTMLVTEVIGAGHSFAVAMSAHTGIGTLPILYYGDAAQKAKYLPDLATGKIKASYCLTEPDSGSDANSGKTRAVLNAAGTHYLITGQKMWITNGGFADLFIVFAKVNPDENLTAFIVERSFGGITMNEEEHKLGIRGSSTRQIFFNECPVPVENMLSTQGNGFKIAVNILNIGRIKLAGAAIGACKMVTRQANTYAHERKQFGQAIAQFGAIQQKLGMMRTMTFATESAIYRAAQNIEDKIHAYTEEGLSLESAKLKATEQYAIECAMLKVHASEVLDYVCDEGLQIYGGMGYSSEAPMERSYRDARINRIFEGTNEINRMLAVGMMLKRTMKGELDLMGPAMAIRKELAGLPDMSEVDGLLGAEKHSIRQWKKAFLMLAGAAVQKYMTTIEDQQEIMMALADILIEVYVAESVLLRVEKNLKASHGDTQELEALLAIYMSHAHDIIAKSGKEIIWSMASGDEQKMLLMGLKRFVKMPPVNLMKARRYLASKL